MGIKILRRSLVEDAVARFDESRKIVSMSSFRDLRAVLTPIGQQS